MDVPASAQVKVHELSLACRLGVSVAKFVCNLDEINRHESHYDLGLFCRQCSSKQFLYFCMLYGVGLACKLKVSE